MNKIEKIGIAGIGPFKKGVVLPIVPGVSFLYGKNLLNGGNANAVGKSLLGNAIADIFYEPTVRQDKPKVGKRFVEFTKGKQRIRILHEVNKTESLRVLVDGEDKAARTNSATKKLAAELWGVTQDEFVTYGFVDAAVPHPLVKGGTAARKAFFTSFFRLDQLDAEKKIFQKQLLEVKKVKAVHEELTKAFASARADMLSKEERTSMEAELADAKDELKRLQALQEKAEKQQRLAAFKGVAGDKLDRLGEVVRTVKDVKRDIADAAEAEEQQEEYQAYRRALERYRKDAEGLDTSISLEVLEKAARKCNDLEDRIEELRSLEEPEPVKPPKGKPGKEKAALEAESRRLKHELEHSRKFNEGVCGTCGQTVKARKAQVVKEELAQVQEELTTWADYEARLLRYEKYVVARDEYAAAKQELATATQTFRQLRQQRELYKKRKNLVKPEKVEKPAKVYDVQALTKELEITKFAEDNADMIEALKDYKPVKFDHSKLNAVQERVYSLKAKLDLHNTVKKRALELRDRLGDLRVAMEKQSALELILEGYADKAMKKMAIESISQHLMATVNRYAALVFENYSFEFVWGTQIQLLVHRPEGTSDVRKLSGAESMLFTLILILSLLVFVPKSKRLSLLILDEPYASFSDGTAELFTKLLPHITQVIPSVLIITPKAEFRVAGAAEFTAVKQVGGTAIKKGHPNEL